MVENIKVKLSGLIGWKADVNVNTKSESKIQSLIVCQSEGAQACRTEFAKCLELTNLSVRLEVVRVVHPDSNVATPALS